MPVRALIGIDIQPIDEVEASLSNFGTRYQRLLFTDHELESCANGFTSAPGLAARFAAKEAVLKILDIRETVPTWRSIEVKCTAGGRPEVVLHDNAAHLAQLQGIRNISLSLGHAGGLASAAVVASVDCQRDKSGK
jgi:holo-[acyl-carrier protein] synthase